jgi:hypothetical protein
VLCFLFCLSFFGILCGWLVEVLSLHHFFLIMRMEISQFL